MQPRDRFLAAARGQWADTRPVWLMRQAGRYLPEYRAIRERVSFLELCANPELACEVTLQPIRRFGMDAAIIFSDILVPVAQMGQTLTFGKGHGPRLDPPVRTWEGFGTLRRIDPEEDTPEVAETMARARSALGDEHAVIGFCGAPFTLLAYMVEGQGSRSFPETKRLLFQQPDLAHAILSLLADVLVDYLSAQIRAGADAVQVFDTWTSLLSPDDFDAFAAPYAARVLAGVEGLGAVRIYFPRGTGAYLDRARSVPCEVLGVDWMQDLERASRLAGADRAVQGNLDPTVLLGSPEALESRMRAMLRAVADRPGYIVNLGHGILPPTDPDSVRRFVDLAHAAGQDL